MKTDVVPRSISDFFPDELFESIKTEILTKNLGPSGDHFYHPVAGRWLTEIRFDQEVEKKILELAQDVFQDKDIQRAGFHTARYQMQNAIKPQLWKHYDQSACQYSLDVCIEKTVDWQLVVDDIAFDESPNSCVVFSGNDNMHWRTPYPSGNEDDYVTLLFMQFAKPDHWFFVEGGKVGFDKYGHLADYKYREKTGEWAQPDYSDGRPICACCDYRIVPTFEDAYLAAKARNETFL
jgi:hypothetical protein